VPGVVFADGEFAPADWLTLSADVPQAVGPEHVETQSASGGNPDAYRDMLFRLGLGTGSGAVAYLRRGMSYDPTVQGAVRVIDYAEDCIALAPRDLTFTDSQLLLQQGARNYISAVLTDPCLAADWRPVASRASLTAADFVLLDGPACAAGEACPDFSAQALPLRFGYRRISFATPGAEVAHGIDNWRVTVWPR
jgi:hypothetical protein